MTPCLWSTLRRFRRRHHCYQNQNPNIQIWVSLSLDLREPVALVQIWPERTSLLQRFGVFLAAKRYFRYLCILRIFWETSVTNLCVVRESIIWIRFYLPAWNPSLARHCCQIIPMFFSPTISTSHSLFSIWGQTLVRLDAHPIFVRCRCWQHSLLRSIISIWIRMIPSQ